MKSIDRQHANEFIHAKGTVRPHLGALVAIPVQKTMAAVTILLAVSCDIEGAWIRPWGLLLPFLSPGIMMLQASIAQLIIFDHTALAYLVLIFLACIPSHQVTNSTNLGPFIMVMPNVLSGCVIPAPNRVLNRRHLSS